MLTPFRLLPFAFCLAACGGEGGPSTPTVVMTKGAPSGDGQSGVVATTLPLPLVVLLTQDGVPVEGRVVTFGAPGGAGTVAPPSVMTGADGMASTMWTLGTTSGARSVTVTSPGVGGSPLQFDATALAGAASTVVIGSGQGQVQEVGLPFGQGLVARVLDVHGNAKPGVTVEWAVTAGSGSVSAATSGTASDGRASVNVVAGATPGTLKVSATVAALPSGGVEFILGVAPVATVITVNNNFFSPADAVIPVGGALRWSWVNGIHNVSPISGTDTFLGAPTQGAGGSYGPIIFDVAGIYTYDCTLHAGMNGTITVQ